MALKFKANFDKSYIEKTAMQAIERMKKGMINELIRIGKSFNKYAEANKGFQNQTFSLISSIGFVVSDDGEIIHQEFIDGGNEVGAQKGIKVAKENTPGQGVCLIAVAGENYAVYVQGKNLDVIQGSSQHATTLLKEVFAKINNNG